MATLSYLASLIMAALPCAKCSAVVKPYPPKYKCEKCGSLLEYDYDFDQLSKVKLARSLSFWKYGPLLPEVINEIF
jgi:threonine synthase